MHTRRAYMHFLLGTTTGIANQELNQKARNSFLDANASSSLVLVRQLNVTLYFNKELLKLRVGILKTTTGRYIDSQLFK